jgi:hypothetical protein
MIRSRDVIPSPLQHAMLATRVLVALDRYEDPGYAPRLNAAMANAVEYLEKIQQGRNYAKDLRITQTAYESALVSFPQTFAVLCSADRAMGERVS